ncbi:MAG: glutamine synthetase beta-grasp domain-containing protein [Myxococcota bacterium]|nr:glutamine synthetase beta-grasp domain-containing protein [Myxococcota bacterium]
MSDATGRDYVLHRTRETGVGLIRLWFADVAGRLKEVTIAAERLSDVLDKGLGVDGGVMGGPTRDESELFLVPDPSTFVLMPASDGGVAMARMFCDVQTATGESAPDDTRAVLKAALERASERGFTFSVGAEIEHF